MESDKISAEIRALLAAERDGMLSTISKRMTGWPFGSITPYALTESGEPTILLSEIAEHTKNVRADTRASLLVRDSKASDDPQAGARATLVGYVIPTPGPFLDDARLRYLELFPNSSSYFGVHDFTLFQLKVLQVRYIGGFGEIHWVDGERIIGHAVGNAADPLARHAAGICAHMNKDHADALLLFAAKLGSIEADSAKMIDADSDGFDMIAVRNGAHMHLRIPFPERATTTEEARKAMVDLVRRVRAS